MNKIMFVAGVTYPPASWGASVRPPPGIRLRPIYGNAVHTSATIAQGIDCPLSSPQQAEGYPSGSFMTPGFALTHNKCYRRRGSCVKMSVTETVLAILNDAVLTYLPCPLPFAREGEKTKERGLLPPLYNTLPPRPPEAGEGDKGGESETK